MIQIKNAVLATGFIALGRGMALMSRDGEASRGGRIILVFLKALLASTPAIGSKDGVSRSGLPGK